uniref:Centromere protein L n=1 Tax=Cacopsylla melanoneura TaxID=428564 RepID=A0A8D8QPG7_9HEMI
MSTYKTLPEFSIDDDIFECFESVSGIVHDVQWKVCLSSPVQEQFLKESCFQTYEKKIKSELSKKNLISSCTTCQIKCKVSENGFSLKVIVDREPVLHCLFLGVDQTETNENDTSVMNTRSRKRYKPFTLLLISGRKTYEKLVLPMIEKLLSCQITTLLLSMRDYHWILSITSHNITSSSVFDNLLHLIYSHPTNESKKHKIIMCVEFEKVLSLWNDIFNKFKISEMSISGGMCEKFKASLQEHFQNIFSLDLTKLSLSEIHIEEILKIKINANGPIICMEKREIIPSVLYFLYQMSHNQQSW